MPPKKDAAAAGVDTTTKVLMPGLDDRETKIIAAAFLSSIGPDKYDYDLMSALTDYTVSTCKKFWPPIKKKVAEAYPTFGEFLGLPAPTATTTADATNNATATSSSAIPNASAPNTKAVRARKRKAEAEVEADADNDKDADPKSGKDATKSDRDAKKKANALTAMSKGKGRATKRLKQEEVSGDEVSDQDTVDSIKGKGKGRAIIKEDVDDDMEDDEVA